MTEGVQAPILLVDDRPEQRLALTALVAELGAEVVEAASGRDALRCLLQRDFALILLDVNMPGMDGFETAALIRQRRNSQHTPIIFITAYGDEAHRARGYSLGAVDYILAPVDPQILRTKVGVFLELFRKTQDVSRHADSLRRYAAQLRRLADAAIAIHGATSFDDLLKIVADTAGSVIGARQVAVDVDTLGAGPPGSERSTRSSICRPETTRLAVLGRAALEHAAQRTVRMTSRELAGRTRWSQIQELDASPPLRGWLASPLARRGGRALGWIQLSEKQGGEFEAEDETMLVQLAQMASIAAENLLLNEAQEANRLKDEFLGTLSHELRTPLQSILTWSRLLRDEPVDAATLGRGLEVIERSARAQTRLIEDLLDVSRIISGKLAIEARSLRLQEVVEASVEEAQPQARERGIHIVSRCADDPVVVGDPNRLRQVMGNLFSNALKFTPRNGRVEVELWSEGGDAHIAMRDTGVGIAAEFLPHLFERFRQADSSSVRTHGGLGLGLSILRELIELHGGTVCAESEGLGRGAMFVVSLPLADESHGASRAAGPAAAPSIDLSGLTVLLVEDEADTRDSLEAALRQHGAEVTAVSSAKEALLAIERLRPDVLLSDLAMPGEDGFSLIRSVRALPPERGGRVPAAAVSAYARAEERARAVVAGFDLHVAKPVEPGELATVVHALSGRADD